MELCSGSPNGIKGICPVGPWNLRVSDGCCVSQLTEVKGISETNNSLDTFNSLNQPSNVSDGKMLENHVIHLVGIIKII